MKVLFVSMVAFENNTSATIQNKGIVKGLSAIGHDIDIMTLRPNQNTISYDDTINDINKVVRHSYYIDIDIMYTMLMAKKQNTKEGSYTKPKKGLIKSGLIICRSLIKKVYINTSIFDAQKVNVKGVSKLKIDYNEYDVIMSASDPKSSHLIVERIYKENKNCKAKWIQYWGDPMLNDITRSNDWRNRLVKYHENKLIAKADRVIYASPLTLKKQKETFMKLYFKMDYASQAYAEVDNEEYSRAEIRPNNNISIGYFGAYYSTIRNIVPLYNTARTCEVKLNICGPSDIKLQSTDNISVQEMVAYKKALQMEQESDILVCICNSRGTQIPGKIYYCTSYNKPIIVILDGEYKQELRVYLESFKRFILCENYEEDIKKAIQAAKKQLGTNDYHISEQLTPEYMGRKILGEF
ncbi:hypothetical protein [Clostridium sp. UBA7339]|uniref:hypothetical protein n=1 Tax=Clostridium sp. UBA7339 TaxID=1946376 RepID=UPI0032165C37